MQRTIDIYKERNKQLEKENREYKGYKLKYEVTKLYVEDDEALLELFEVAKTRNQEQQEAHLRHSARLQAMYGTQALTGGLSALGGLGGTVHFR